MTDIDNGSRGDAEVAETRRTHRLDADIHGLGNSIFVGDLRVPSGSARSAQKKGKAVSHTYVRARAAVPRVSATSASQREMQFVDRAARAMQFVDRAARKMQFAVRTPREMLFALQTLRETRFSPLFATSPHGERV